jgi:hypothetical protein
MISSHPRGDTTRSRSSRSSPLKRDSMRSRLALDADAWTCRRSTRRADPAGPHRRRRPRPSPASSSMKARSTSAPPKATASASRQHPTTDPLWPVAAQAYPARRRARYGVRLPGGGGNSHAVGDPGNWRRAVAQFVAQLGGVAGSAVATRSRRCAFVGVRDLPASLGRTTAVQGSFWSGWCAGRSLAMCGPLGRVVGPDSADGE